MGREGGEYALATCVHYQRFILGTKSYVSVATRKSKGFISTWGPNESYDNNFACKRMKPVNVN